ncbi:hypothetical protein GCM10009614_21180 [Glutamicibacter uratoxydans]
MRRLYLIALVGWRDAIQAVFGTVAQGKTRASVNYLNNFIHRGGGRINPRPFSKLEDSRKSIDAFFSMLTA